MKRILSFGAGVNSMAILALKIQGKVKFDHVIFSDTGSEMPETYHYIKEIVIPLCKDHNIKFDIVGKKTLYDDYYKINIIPYRAFRSCTDKYKIRPINKLCKQLYGDDYIMLIGIDYGEKRRIKFYKKVEYPLVDLGINRAECKNIIKGMGLPVPVKSGCWFCPFMSMEEWKKLYKQNPILFNQAEKLEKNCRAYPKSFLSTKYPLEKLRKAFESQTELTEFIDKQNIQKCVYCE